MAGMLMEALRRAGHEAFLASTLRSFHREQDMMALDRLREQSAAERQQLMRCWEGTKSIGPPDLWFTYHPYYKSPDLLGPTISEMLRIPYVTAEASLSAKRSEGPWAPWQEITRRGVAGAALNFWFTPQDCEGLSRALGAAARLWPLPPFVECDLYRERPDHPPRPVASAGVVQLLTVAMMRAGAKLRSYAFLAEALRLLHGAPWHLTVVGDGRERPAVEALFAGLPPERITWRGVLPPALVREAFTNADIFLWPGFDEAYGLVYLEAQASGVPVVALRSGGVASVVQHVLVDGQDPAAYAAAVQRFIDNPHLRVESGIEARRHVRAKHDIDAAAKAIDAGFRNLNGQSIAVPAIPHV
jgi:glycosyltransferase involved in cell wall biosynthesis